MHVCPSILFLVRNCLIYMWVYMCLCIYIPVYMNKETWLLNLFIDSPVQKYLGGGPPTCWSCIKTFYAYPTESFKIYALS